MRHLFLILLLILSVSFASAQTGIYIPSAKPVRNMQKALENPEVFCLLLHFDKTDSTLSLSDLDLLDSVFRIAFSTTNYHVFRAGIAIAPPTSWRYYDTIYTERYMRTPNENPLGYDESPIGRAAQLHGALLICHGLADDNVHYRNTADYTKALIQADKDYSQLVYTDCNHSINGGNSRNHLFRQCVSFFKRELK